MTIARRTFVAALSAVALLAGAVPADAQAGGRGGGHWGGPHGSYGHRGYGYGPLWGGVGLGIGLGLGSSLYYGGPWNRGYVWVERPVIRYEDEVIVSSPQRDAAPAIAPAVPAPPEPVIYPRAGQTPTQTEADRQACNRWATTQPSAMRDAAVFQRATAACMEGRDYVVK